MLTTRLMVLLGSIVINLNMTTCRSPGEPEKSAPSAGSKTPTRVELEGIDTGELTPREHAQWSAHVSEMLAPCEDTPVSVAECIQKKQSCAACAPAAKYLLKQVRQGLTHGQVEAIYQARFSSEAVREIDIADSPIKGPPSAPITIVEFADFECPACRAASLALNEVVAESDDVRMVFINYPLGYHQNAETAARAVEAAGLQNKFWEMHTALFASEVPPDSARVKAIASKLKLDMEKFEADLRSEAIADAVVRDRKEGEKARLSATPTIFVNGREFHYAYDLKTDLLEWLELERQMLSPAAK